MSYKPINNFKAKDTLGPNDPEKIIYGADLQDEFDAISDNLESVGEDLIEIGEVVEEAPSDNVVYGRKNDKWVSVALEAGGVEEAPSDGKQYARENADWSEVVLPAEGVPEAPKDGKQYAREDATWTEVVPATPTTSLPASAITDGDMAYVGSIDLTNGTVKADAVEVTTLTVNGTAYAPYDDTQVKADISANTAGIVANYNAIRTKLDASKIWTGTEAQYNALSPLDATTLYFITA